MTTDDMLLPLSLYSYDVEAAHRAKGEERGRIQQLADANPAGLEPDEPATSTAGSDETGNYHPGG